VDATIAAGVVGAAMAQLPAAVPAFAMAPIVYGKSEEHLHFPGTVTLSGETLLATINEIGESVYRAGFRKLLFVNGHGGQPQVLEIAARELRLRHGDFIVVPSFTWRVPHVAGQYLSNLEKKLAMHAGHAETALMLALAPQTVHMERAVINYPPVFPSSLLSPDGRPACAWTARDFGPSGVIGDPTPATAEQGQEILQSWPAAGPPPLPSCTAAMGQPRRSHLGPSPASGACGACPGLTPFLALPVSNLRRSATMKTAKLLKPLTCAAMLACGLSGLGHAEEKFVYMTNWYAQAEHGGFYQAVATGLYKSMAWKSASRWAAPRSISRR
jgi:creatinine amidohydrolase/Fe(II)-dependent formamide hydrolase-like protein